MSSSLSKILETGMNVFKKYYEISTAYECFEKNR